MPCTAEAVTIFEKNGVLYAPGKASNAGGVATSGLEMSQNAMRMSWTAEEVDERLLEIMQGIHRSCLKYGTREDGTCQLHRRCQHCRFRKSGRSHAGSGCDLIPPWLRRLTGLPTGQ